jgi:hypothetical protein
MNFGSQMMLGMDPSDRLLIGTCDVSMDDTFHHFKLINFDQLSFIGLKLNLISSENI